MKTLNVTVSCMAVYTSSIEVPLELSLEEAIEYAKEHINEIHIGELEYISDSDEIDVDNCDFKVDDCPLGGDISNDCEGCAYSGDYHYDHTVGECVRRESEMKVRALL